MDRPEPSTPKAIGDLYGDAKEWVVAPVAHARRWKAPAEAALVCVSGS